MFGTLYLKEADNTLHDKNISFLIKHFIYDECLNTLCYSILDNTLFVFNI